MTRQQFPALGVQVLAAGALVIFSWGSGDASKPGSPLKEHRAFMEMLALFLGGFAVSFCLYQLPLARYWVMMIFPLTSFIAILAARFRRSSMLFALALIVWNGLNQYGRFLPALPDRSGHLLERSREFLKDLDANRFLCHKLEADFFNAPIVAKTPYAEMLTTPEFGYVQAALPTVIAADYFARFGKSADFQSLRSMTLTRDVKTLCLFSPTIFERLYAPSLVPRAGEKILLVEHSLPYPVVLYIRRWNKETAL